MARKNTAVKILNLLKKLGSATAQQLASELDISAMGVRQHLDKLELAGSVAHIDKRQGVGRPARLYRLSRESLPVFPDHHDTFALELLEAMDEEFGPEGLARLLQRREGRLFERYQRVLSQELTLDERLEKLVELRSSDGYMAAMAVQKNGYLFEQHHCPIYLVAKEREAFCQGELVQFRTCLQQQAQVKRVCHKLKGDHCCSYQITPLESPEPMD